MKGVRGFDQRELGPMIQACMECPEKEQNGSPPGEGLMIPGGLLSWLLSFGNQVERNYHLSSSMGALTAEYCSIGAIELGFDC
ncbi:hypothetical protein COLO4_05083 [Corchorus olitorius]|uniref:Uncharacterized protein n=1 Tax=Corchorus olitorius TaxID=93759 RepID=A0A1R3KRW7_9ROSI|nr:hypothetical protein COLO4_05083 [Corchorus olitorius]